jgi:C4-dicarboxylate-specific signal transduction histidine kinase
MWRRQNIACESEVERCRNRAHLEERITARRRQSQNSKSKTTAEIVDSIIAD